MHGVTLSVLSPWPWGHQPSLLSRHAVYNKLPRIRALYAGPRVGVWWYRIVCVLINTGGCVLRWSRLVVVVITAHHGATARVTGILHVRLADNYYYGLTGNRQSYVCVQCTCGCRCVNAHAQAWKGGRVAILDRGDWRSLLTIDRSLKRGGGKVVYPGGRGGGQLRVPFNMA